MHRRTQRLGWDRRSVERESVSWEEVGAWFTKAVAAAERRLAQKARRDEPAGPSRDERVER